MIFPENARLWVKTAENEELTLKRSGEDRYESEDGRATLALRSVCEDGVHAIYLSGRLAQGCYSSELAAGITIPDNWGFEMFFADSMRGDANWAYPTISNEFSHIQWNTQSLMLKYSDDRYGLILPVCDAVYKCVMHGGDDGLKLAVTSYYDKLDSIDETLAFMYAEDSDPYKLVGRCAEYAIRLMGTGVKLRRERRYPEIFEYLGWCSWDALEIRVNTEDLLRKCREFREKGIPVRWSIIDDMWAECDNLRDIPEDLCRANGMFSVMHSSKMCSFEADSKRFPGGLKECISRMNKEYDMQVGMWHPANGYWSGLAPNEEADRQTAGLTRVLPNGRIYPDISELSKAFLFYNKFHDFLKDCGAAFLKIDNQGFICQYKNEIPVGIAARNFHRAVESSVGSHFDNDLINCMGMANENMWNRPLSPISRCSGDFQPENRAWFIKHLLMCSYNSMIQGEFLWCDWDMWWSDDEQGRKNSVLRALSGGPIYVSDKLDRSRADVLAPLALSDGRILRCDAPAVPTEDCLFVDHEHTPNAFKVRNTCTYGNSTAGLVAAFDITSDNLPVSGAVSAADCSLPEGRYALYERFTNTAVILEPGERFEFTLESQDDYRLFVLVPMTGDIAPLGLIDKFIAPKTIVGEAGELYDIPEGGRIGFISADGRTHEIVTESGRYTAARDGLLCAATVPTTDKYFRID